MKTALIYDEPTGSGDAPWVEAEYESPETIRALLEAIGSHCDQAVALPFGSDLMERLRTERPDLVFNIAEGREGPSRESLVPAVLDFLGIPYTGSDAVALGISLNKAVTKRLAAELGIPTPPLHLFHTAEEADARAEELDYPALAKPNFGGSSVGVGPESVVRRPEDLPETVARDLERYGQPCLVERYIEGEDVTVGLLGNGRPEILPVGRVVTRGGMYSELVKKLHDREVVCPCEVPEDLRHRLGDYSLDIHRAIGARDLSRVDYILDSDGRPWFLEINPLPGLSPYYGVLPVLAEAAGYGHTQLIGRIMNLVQQRLTERAHRSGDRVAGATAQQHPNC